MKTEILNQEAVAAWLPDRDPWGHKGDFGKLLLLCGSVGYTGAAALAARAAVRSGAGLVLLGVPEPVYTIEAVKLDEPVVFPLAAEGDGLSPAAVPEILRRLAGCDACLVGPGLGRLPGVRAVTEAVLREARCPVVLDADGLNVLEGAADALKARRAPTCSHAPRWGVSPPGRGGGTGSDGLCGGFGPDAGGGGPPEGSQDCGDRWNPGI